MRTARARLCTHDRVLFAEVDVPWSENPPEVILAGRRIFVRETFWSYVEARDSLTVDLPAAKP